MNTKSFYLIALVVLTISGVFWFWMFQNRSAVETAAGETVEITMYRSEGCECCLHWATHVESNGFLVTVHAVDNLPEIKTDNHVSSDLASCHTAIVDGYVIEGHVPATDIRRLLNERPDAAGISVPGMPIGSPGMEGTFSESYNVVLFDSAGNRTVYAQY